MTAPTEVERLISACDWMLPTVIFPAAATDTEPAPALMEAPSDIVTAPPFKVPEASESATIETFPPPEVSSDEAPRMMERAASSTIPALVVDTEPTTLVSPVVPRAFSWTVAVALTLPVTATLPVSDVTLKVVPELLPSSSEEDSSRMLTAPLETSVREPALKVSPD